jgi:hypothetical protein
MTTAAAVQLGQLEWARDCYAQGLGQAVEDQIAYLRTQITPERGERHDS